MPRLTFARFFRFAVAFALSALHPSRIAAQEGAPSPWKIEGELGGAVFFGNHPSLTAASRLSAARSGPERELSAEASFGYGLATDRAGDTFVSKRSWAVSSAFDHRPAQAWSPFAFTRVEGSYELRVDLRYNLGLGAKYTFLGSDAARADASLALLVEHTEPAGAGRDAVDLVRWSARLRGRRSAKEGRLTLESETFVRPRVTDLAEFTLTSTNAVGLVLSDRLTLKLSFLDSFDSEAEERGARSNNDGQLLLSCVTVL